MFYSDWGFKGNPFDTTALPGNDHGLSLLVGRQGEIKKLTTRLENSSKIPTIEGLNGVGKTSLVNVVLYKKYLEATRSNVGPLFIPCRSVFQLDPNVDLSDFRSRVFLEIAQTLFEKHSSLVTKPGFLPPREPTSLKRFINSPEIKSYSASLVSVGGGVQAVPNDGFAFERNGFESTVKKWLKEIFPTTSSGGVVCVIDNLELLQTSVIAREIIEKICDDLLATNGVRWIFCGALGIVHGVASSPRMDGKLHKPITVEDLTEDFATEIYKSRIKTFRSHPRAQLPISQTNFIELFDIMRGNIRSVLSECDDYCHWVADCVEDVDDFEGGMFENWMQEELEAAYNAVRAELSPSAMRLFNKACQFEIFSPSDCHHFGYQKPQAMRPYIRALEQVGLLSTSIDDSDKRRKTIQVTPKGWKVRAYLDFFEDEFIN